MSDFVDDALQVLMDYKAGLITQREAMERSPFIKDAIEELRLIGEESNEAG